MRISNILFSRVGKWSKQYSNLPDRYIKRAMEQVYWRNPKGINYRPGAVVQRKKFYFGVHRPWTAEFRNDNAPGTLKPKVFIEPIKEWNFFRGDRVEILVGIIYIKCCECEFICNYILVGKDKGKQGIVKHIFEERNWVIVGGLNCKLKQIGRDKKREFEGIWIQEEQPLLITNEVALVDPSDLAPTTVEWRLKNVMHIYNC